MIIYLDLVILFTIIVNILIIEGIETIFNDKINKIRVTVSCIMSVLLLSLYILPIGKIVWIRYLLGIPIGIVSFPKSRVTKKIIKIVFYYLLNLAIVGTLSVFKIHNFTFLIISTLLVVILGIITSYRNSYEKEISINKKTYNALYDSGNCSYYQNKPIIYLNESLYTNDYQIIGECFVNNIFGTSKIDIYIGPKIKIGKREHEVYYAFMKINEYDLILHKDLGGIKCLNY